MNDRTSIFNRHRNSGESVQPTVSAVQPSPAAPKLPYKATFAPSDRRPQHRLRLVLDDHSITLLSYAYVSEIAWNIPGNEGKLALIYTNGTALVDGQNLEKLLDILQENEARELVRFDPAVHETPESGEAVITGITWKRTIEALGLQPAQP